LPVASHVTMPPLWQVLVPGAHVPMHAPDEQALLPQSAAAPHAPDAMHVSTPFPAQRTAPEVHGPPPSSPASPESVAAS
jgi:hypothetical protein